jgi:hypothetical protein
VLAGVVAVLICIPLAWFAVLWMLASFPEMYR